jgi:hypothetical protein
LEDVNRAFNRIDRGLKSNLNKALKKAGEPVRADAQQLGPHVIRNLRRGPGPSGADWSAARIGLTQRTVYVAPVERGRARNPKKKRPNFKTLVLDRVYEPALEHNRQKVADAFGGLLDDIHDAWSV